MKGVNIMSNYLTYPCKNMKITQSYSGTTSHKPHTTGKPADFPWDEAGADGGREWMYCPCDEMKIVRLYTRGANTIWLESTSEVDFADGTSDFASGQITHPNNDDFKNLKEGQIFKRGEKICREGTDGNATGNHFHFSFGKGKIKGSGWTQNSNGKWVLTTTNGTYKPEKLFYVDKSFTKVIQTKGISFKTLPKAKKSKYSTGDYEVTTSLLRVRKGAGTKYSKKKFRDFTVGARNQIIEIAGRPMDGYVKGVQFTALEVSGNWGKTPSGWVHLGYCKKLP